MLTSLDSGLAKDGRHNFVAIQRSYYYATPFHHFSSESFGAIFRFIVTDDAGKSADDTITITVCNVPILVPSATYNPDSDTLSVTFNRDICNIPDCSRLHVCNAGSNIGGIAFMDMAACSCPAVIVTLDSWQQNQHGDLQNLQLDVETGAVRDVDGVWIPEMSDLPLRNTGSGKKSSASAPAVDMNTLESMEEGRLNVPPYIAEPETSRGKSDLTGSMMSDGTFDRPHVMDGGGGG